MPSIWKNLTNPKAEPYRLLTEEELTGSKVDVTEEDAPEEEETPVSESEEKAAIEEADDPIHYAQIQAEMILRDARRQGEKLIEQAKEDAQKQSEEIFENARNEGREEGFTHGMAEGRAQALEEARQLRVTQTAEQAAAVQAFLEKAGKVLDQQLDENVDEMRDLALAVAEKIVSVSLKSSSDVISRMIQAAVDKRKRREWVHIYIAECDAKRMVKVPVALSSALSDLSSSVRIIPMPEDEAGTCIIEMPDEIIDASASTQMKNIQAMLSNATPDSGVIGGQTLNP